MKRAISFAAKHTASFFAALNNSISDNILSLERFITASFAQIYKFVLRGILQSAAIFV